MAVYRNTKADSPITSVEFSPVSDGNFSFFYVDSPISVKGVRQWLTSADTGQEVIAESLVNGHPVIVTHGDKDPQALLGGLQKRGEHMVPYVRKKEFSETVWPTGAAIATVGQLLQLSSSFLRPDRKKDWSLLMFAVPNLTASAWIFFYGAQRSKDPHRLTYMKRHINEELGAHVPGGQESLPSIDDTRLRLHQDQDLHQDMTDRVNGFLERNSVTVGEIGMRYIAAANLAFPSDKWGKGFNRLLNGEFKGAYEAARNPKSWSHAAGLGSLAGKTISIASKADDPFNPKPSSALDRIREKFTFRIGGWIETGAFATLAADGFAHKKISFTKGGKQYADFLSGIGGSLFTIRYAMRHWAPFGVRDMNMPELYAHVTDGLAQLPPDKLPQLLADTAADITNQFKDKHLKYGEVFSQLLLDLYRYHHIALDNLGTEPDERLKKNGTSKTRPENVTEPAHTLTAKQTLRTPKSAKEQAVEKSTSHVDQLRKKSPSEIGLT
ncbi:MAG: hypothetical protein AB7L92_03960 [Alphaproteobacteria bacterium]